MIRLIITVSFLLMTSFAQAQVFFTEDFETDGNGTRYFAEVDADDPGTENDYFFRTDGTGMNANSHLPTDYVNISGSYFWAGEDHNDPQVGGSGNEELSIEFNDISIAGKSNIYFTALLGGNSAAFQYESVDYVIIEYRIDNGAWLEGLSYHQNSADQLSLDTNGDDIGDGYILNDVLTPQEFSIPELGNEIDLRLRAANNSSSEEWAMDLIQLSENSTLNTEAFLINDNDVKIFETNTNRVFEIKVPNNLQLETIEVYSFTGALVKTIKINNTVVNLSSLQASIYILKINTNKGSINKRLILK